MGCFFRKIHENKEAGNFDHISILYENLAKSAAPGFREQAQWS